MQRRMLLLAVIPVFLVFSGCKAGKPGKLESSMVDGIKRNVTVGGKDWKNPVADTADARKEGQEHFEHHCGICHGLDGQNTGVPFAEKMDPPVADLSTKDMQEYGDGQFKWIIQNGIRPSGMPGWEGILSDDEMWKIVIYMRHLPPKGSLGIPEIYKEEQEEHEKAEHGGSKGQPAGESKPHSHNH